MAQNIKVRHFENRLQKDLKKTCENIKNEPKLIIPADKTSNFYKLDCAQYEALRSKDVQKTYKKEKEKTFENFR